MSSDPPWRVKKPSVLSGVSVGLPANRTRKLPTTKIEITQVGFQVGITQRLGEFEATR